MSTEYIHGVHEKEQDRLRLLNKMTNTSFLDFVEIADGDQVLELGSGLGMIANTIAGNNQSVKVTGIEYSPEQIAQCEQHLENVDYLQGDVHALPFKSASYDVIYGRYILEHLHDPATALREAFRVLKPGGKVYFQENTVSLVRHYPECPAFDIVWGKIPVLQDRLGGDAEIGIKLYSLLVNAGFRNVTPTMGQEIHYPDKGTLKSWVDNLIGNIEGASKKLIEFNLCTAEQVSNAIRELESLKVRPDASAYFYWNRIEGTK